MPWRTRPRRICALQCTSRWSGRSGARRRFERAQAEDKPILLDIGAVWCHWCHVMDRESYEDPATAQIINEHFVAVKVDRDERPDVDTRYQAAVPAISGQGGWPLTAFLTPEGKPYFGGTYFPPEDRHGRPSFQRVLLTMAEAFHEAPRRGERIGRQRDGRDRAQRVLLRAGGESGAGTGGEDGGRRAEAVRSCGMAASVRSRSFRTRARSIC